MIALSINSERTVVYFCYGSEAIYDQTIYSILTILYHAPVPRDFDIVVYCDRPAVLAALPVKTMETDAKLLEAYLGGTDYIHRRKTCVVMDALQQFNGKILFFDSDTYLTGSPAALFDHIGPGRVCFHICEGFVQSTGTPFDTALATQVKVGGYALRSGEPVRIDRHTRMWNTGVVGVHASDLDTMQEALALSDAIWAGANPDGPFGQKIHHAEQFAMGYAFRNHWIAEAADRVYHYWPAKAKGEFGVRLPSLVASGLYDQSRENLRHLYGQRYQQKGVIARLDRMKMAARRRALSRSLALKGVRQSV